MPVPERPKKRGRYVVLADVRGAVHGEHVALGQQKIQDAEDAFFHFAGIFGAADEDDFAGEVDQDEGGGAGAVAFGDGFEFRRGDDGELGHVLREFLLGRPQKELVNEESVPGVFGDDFDRQAVASVGAGEEVL